MMRRSKVTSKASQWPWQLAKKDEEQQAQLVAVNLFRSAG